jgi:hypothetical protein
MLHVRLCCKRLSKRAENIKDLIPNRLSPRHAKNCVYNVYADDTLAYNEGLSSALSALESALVPRLQWPAPILALDRKSRPKSGGESSNAQDATDEDVTDVMDSMDPGLKAFLE